MKRALIIFLLLTGCTVKSDYAIVQFEIPADMVFEMAKQLNAMERDLTGNHEFRLSNGDIIGVFPEKKIIEGAGWGVYSTVLTYDEIDKIIEMLKENKVIIFKNSVGDTIKITRHREGKMIL